MEYVCGIIVLIVLIGLFVMLTLWYDRRRTRAVQALMTQIGFLPSQLQRPDAKFGTALFALGRDPLAARAIEGTISGLSAVVFDYYYDVPDGDSDQTKRQTVAAFASPHHTLPDFELKAKGLFSGRSIDVPDPGFAQRFVLTGKDSQELLRLYQPSLLRFLTSANPRKRLHIEGHGPWLVLYQPGKSVKPAKWNDFLQETSQLANGFFQNAHSASPPRSGQSGKSA